MTKLPAMAAADVIKKLKAGGFIFDRYAKGSHEIWYNPNTKRRVTIPNHTLHCDIECASMSPYFTTGIKHNA